MNPARYDVHLIAGADFDDAFTAYEDDGTTLLDLTGWTVSYLLKQGSATVATCTVTVTTPTNGYVVVKLLAATVDTLSGAGTWVCSATDGTNTLALCGGRWVRHLDFAGIPSGPELGTRVIRTAVTISAGGGSPVTLTAVLLDDESAVHVIPPEVHGLSRAPFFTRLRDPNGDDPLTEMSGDVSVSDDGTITVTPGNWTGDGYSTAVLEVGVPSTYSAGDVPDTDWATIGAGITVTNASVTSAQPTIAGTYLDDLGHPLSELSVTIDGQTYTTGDAALTAVAGAWSLNLATAGQSLTDGSYDVGVIQSSTTGKVGKVDTDAITVALAPLTPASPTYRYGYRSDATNGGVYLTGPAFTFTSEMAVILQGVIERPTGAAGRRVLWQCNDGTRSFGIRIDDDLDLIEVTGKDSGGTSRTASLAWENLPGGTPFDREVTIAAISLGGNFYIYFDGVYTKTSVTVGCATGLATDTQKLFTNSGTTSPSAGAFAVAVITAGVDLEKVRQIQEAKTFDNLMSDGTITVASLMRTTAIAGTQVSSMDDAVAGAAAWSAAGGGTNGDATEHGSGTTSGETGRSRYLLTLSESNQRVTGQSSASGRTFDTDSRIFSDPAQDGAALESSEAWLTLKGGELGYLDDTEVGTTPRLIAKYSRSSQTYGRLRFRAEEVIEEMQLKWGLPPTNGLAFVDTIAADGNGTQDEADLTSETIPALVEYLRDQGFVAFLLSGGIDPDDPPTVSPFGSTVRANVLAYCTAQSDCTYADFAAFTKQVDGVHADAAACIDMGEIIGPWAEGIGIWDAQ